MDEHFCSGATRNRRNITLGYHLELLVLPLALPVGRLHEIDFSAVESRICGGETEAAAAAAFGWRRDVEIEFME